MANTVSPLFVYGNSSEVLKKKKHPKGRITNEHNLGWKGLRYKYDKNMKIF